jgi:hypothetical protein
VALPVHEVFSGDEASMKLFHLYRVEDESGVSGTGPVVEGVEFTNGWCAIRWMSSKSTICFYQSLADVKAIHGHGGKTELVIHNFEPTESPKSTVGTARFEMFLELMEELSDLMTRVEDRETSLEEVHESIEHIKDQLDLFEKQLRRKYRKTA